MLLEHALSMKKIQVSFDAELAKLRQTPLTAGTSYSRCIGLGYRY
jgi:hypothetical protein